MGEAEVVPANIADFRPDATFKDNWRMLFVVWEFTQGMAEDDEKFELRAETNCIQAGGFQGAVG